MERTPVRVAVRERVTSYLAFLSSDRARRLVGERIDPQQLAFELCRVWFDEIYVPGIGYFDGLKGDYSEAAANAFREAFDDEELAALERFHRFFELRVEMLRKLARTSEGFPESDQWRQLVKDAGYLLEDLEPNAGALRRRLEEHLSSPETAEELVRLLAGVSRGEG